MTAKIVSTLLAMNLTIATYGQTAGPAGVKFSGSVESSAFAFRGLAPHANIALLGITVRADGGVLTKRPFAAVRDDHDGDGVISYPPPDGMHFRSVCAAVDLRTGALAVATPSGFVVPSYEIAAKRVTRSTDGLVSELQLNALSVHLLVVRPGEGAWVLQAFDGGAEDNDKRSTGTVSVQFQRARPVGATKISLNELRPGDVLVALDDMSIELNTLTISGK